MHNFNKLFSSLPQCKCCMCTMLKNAPKISENSDVFDFVFVLILSIEMDFLMCPLVET